MKTVAEYSDDLAPEYQSIIKSVLALLDKHNASVRAMMFKIGEKFYGYKPLKSYHQNPNYNIKKEREENLALEFVKIESEFAKHEIEVILCIITLKEGGEMVIVPKTSLFYSVDAANKAKQLINYNILSKNDE